MYDPASNIWHKIRSLFIALLYVSCQNLKTNYKYTKDGQHGHLKKLHKKAKYGETGVGLSIVKSVLENHKGVIQVESKPGNRSTHKIY